MDDKYEILIDGIANAIAHIGEDNFDDYNQIIKNLSRVLATAAKLESEMVSQCEILIDAVAWTIGELLDCIDSGSTCQQSEIIGNLAKALAEVAKSNSKPQALFMPARVV